MAELFFIPQWSPMTEPIIKTACYTYKKYEGWSMLAFYNVYHPIGELLFFFIPSILISIVLWIGCFSFYLASWIIWWMIFLQSRWKLLAASGRTTSEILRDPNPIPHSHVDARLKRLGAALLADYNPDQNFRVDVRTKPAK